ncbi:B12-binding domain-containing radical SAM protein [Limnohabitans sp. Rim11]|uniref:B12-binding domain-containing radical SAM protein n=1 Tax=Limnohabitans sp. Rim11 TaxID=1100719 RepID=UPI000B7F4B02|nr:B12-binding domain-containing radical SAM protein [Limnohabitans sp. Rim11]
MAELQQHNPAIILCTLNAKYIHASLGLRYLLANMSRHGRPELAAQTLIVEYTLARQTADMVEDLLAKLGPVNLGQTQIIGFGVYIWNVLQTTVLVRQLKMARPSIKIILGGPEVSHEIEQQDIVQMADHVITGWGDVSFPKLCNALVYGPKPLMKVIQGEQPPMDQIELPYQHFSDDDLAHRVLYVEASRGCPFKCEFCLSSLDKTAWAFDLSPFLNELDILYKRGARNFKFVDRTFNLKIESSIQILQFFLDRLASESPENLLVHFEVIPDHLPDRLKAMIAQFPPGVLQFEVGIQSFNEEVQKLISRRQDNVQTEANLRWLITQSNAHLHTDLIFGLPGETMESFAIGFDRLWAIGPQEIQLGILKRLRGTPIDRHTQTHGMVYDAQPPYMVQQTKDLDRTSIQRFARMAKYWDLVVNSGRFKKTISLLMAPTETQNSAFWSFMQFSDALWAGTGKTYGLSPEILVDGVFDYLTKARGFDADLVRPLLLEDYLASGARARPQCLAQERLLLGGDKLDQVHTNGGELQSFKNRQNRHVA